MTLKRKAKESIPELRNPGDPEAEWCSPGSIEQQLDMCEEGSLRGDEILHHHGTIPPEYSETPISLDQLVDEEMELNWNMDLSEADREGDEMSGDEHSSGIEGGDSEMQGQPHIYNGLPGDFTRHEERLPRPLLEPGEALPEGTVIPFRRPKTAKKTPTR